MGQKAIKTRRAISRAKKKGTKADSKDVTTPDVTTDASATVVDSDHKLADALKMHQDVSSESSGAIAKRPVRQTAQALSNLLHQIRMDELIEPGDEEFVQSATDESDDINMLSDDSSSEEDANPQDGSWPSAAVKRPPSKKVAKVDELSDSEGYETFSMTFELMNQHQGTRNVEVFSSDIIWAILQQRLAKGFNVYPSSLQVQYRFSNELKAFLLKLENEEDLKKLIMLITPHVVPPILANGHRSKRKMKLVTVQVFNKGDAVEASDKKSSRTMKNNKIVVEKDRDVQEVDERLQKRLSIREQIATKYRCSEHSQPDKPVTCWKDPVSMLCYPITKQNLNMWAALCARDEETFSIDTKPLQVNVMLHGPRGRPKAAMSGPSALMSDFAPQNTQMPAQNFFPYPTHPSPWWSTPFYPPSFAQGHGSGPMFPHMTHAQPSSPPINCPTIPQWLAHCDNHPQRHIEGSDFSSLAQKLKDKGFRELFQLASDLIRVGDLSQWLDVMPGTAHFIISYAVEDLRAMQAGTFQLMSDSKDVPN